MILARAEPHARTLCWHRPPRVQMDEFRTWPLVAPARLSLPACGVCGVPMMRANSGTLYHTLDDSVPSLGDQPMLAQGRRTPHPHTAQQPETFS